MEASKLYFPQGLTFNDVLLLPNYSDFSRSNIDLSANLTKKIKLKIPFVSAPMDTVTEAMLALALAKIGGIGIIHRNLTITKQAEEVSKIKSKKLLVGAAIGASRGYEKRLRALANAKVDVIVLDSAHGYTKFLIKALKEIKKQYPKLQIIAGNIATYEAARALIKAGADGLRVGMGPGAICTTRVISGMGVPQITAITETALAARKNGVPIIADGGIVNSGDMVKALAAGADSMMMGGFFASAIESPGKKIKLSANQIPHRFKSILNHGKSFVFKEYRGIGSEGAMEKGVKVKSEDEFHGKDYRDRILIAEGVEGLVPIKGTVTELVETAIGGIKSGFYYCGAKNIYDLHKKARFIRTSHASLAESHPHDILVTNPGKSYA